MTKRIIIIVSAVFAVAVIFAGARTFACGGDHCKASKTASMTGSGSCCPGASGAAMTSSHACPYAGAAMASDSKSGYGCSAKAGMSGCSQSCMSKNGMTHAGCGMSGASNGHYGANVFAVRDGHEWAVCNGKTFEVSDQTPYSDVGPARYYFADENSRVTCVEKMAMMAKELDQEAVSLATSEGNVTTDSDGQKYGVCPVTHDKFLITADSPAKVMDGQKYYVCSEKCAAELMQTADWHPAN